MLAFDGQMRRKLYGCNVSAHNEITMMSAENICGQGRNDNNSVRCHKYDTIRSYSNPDGTEFGCD